VNGAVFQTGVQLDANGNAVGATYQRNLSDLEVPAETIWLQDGRNYESDTGPWAIARCWCGPPGDPFGGDVPSASSPCGQIVRQYGWLINHLKGTHFLFADGHVKWTRVQSAIANNLWKWHCFQRPGEKTFAGGANVKNFDQNDCRQPTPDECRNVASLLVANEYR
jgi:prepilin-type processing-associated H-X9-DG protein